MAEGTPERAGSGRFNRLALLAWSMWVVSFVLLALGVFFSLLTRGVPDPNAFGLPFDALLSAALLAFPTVGALVASRRRGNAIGWLFCVVGVLFGVQSAAYGWGVYTLFTQPGELPGAELAAWLSTWLFVPALFCIPVYLFLLFPDDRSPGAGGPLPGWPARGCWRRPWATLSHQVA